MSHHGRSRGMVLGTLGLGAGAVLIAGAAVVVAGGAGASPPLPPPRPVAPPPGPGPAGPPPAPPAEAYVELFDELNLQGRRLTLRPGNDIRSLDGVPSDDATGGFEDRPASVRWNIPVGWQLVLFEHKNFEGNRHELKGTGRIEDTPNLGCFTDEASSARWEFRP